MDVLHTNSIRVGAVACRSMLNELDENMSTIRNWTAKAQEKNVELLLFPELCITGYSTEPVMTILPESYICQQLLQLAYNAKITLAVGMVWQDQAEGDKYVAQGLWLPNGEYYIYRKTHLGMREKQQYAAGDQLPVFTLPKVHVGMQLCLEHHFPDISQTLALRGAELILCPHAIPRLTPQERREKWLISLRARAYDNCVYVLATNQVGDNGQGILYPGGLLLIDPAGQVLVEDFSGEAAMITADIDVTQVMASRMTPQGMCRRFYATARRPELYA